MGARARAGLLAAAGLGLLGPACAGRGPAYSAGPSGQAERPTGCVDTPVIAGDPRGTSPGIGCGRERSPAAALIHGRVVGEGPGGLPGPGLEGLWVGVHPVTGPLRLDHLPPARASVVTGPQGGFAVAGGAGELVVTVRASEAGPILAAQRLGAQADRGLALTLQVASGSAPESASEVRR